MPPRGHGALAPFFFFGLSTLGLTVLADIGQKVHPGQAANLLQGKGKIMVETWGVRWQWVDCFGVAVYLPKISSNK